jgi:uncharacterized repeat protein (TIGR03803 family)
VTDGSYPEGALVFDAQGNLYGTTFLGGSNCGNYGCGTAFELSPPITGVGWNETVLHAFVGPSSNGDGFFPDNGLVFDAKGNLYGTTPVGGAYDYGAAFELSPPTEQGGEWTEQVIYSFIGAPDGTNPQSGLTPGANGVFYGVASTSGPAGYGTVYQLTPPAKSSGAWALTVLFSFNLKSPGGEPWGPLALDASGNLYGATAVGGDYSCPSPYNDGCGVAFELVYSSGGYSENVLHSFTGTGGDGIQPESGLIMDAFGNLYGTTELGGTHGDGTVFEIPSTTVVSISSTLNPSTYGQAVTFTAAISLFRNVKGRQTRNGKQSQAVTGTVTWSANTGCGSTPVTSGAAVCTTSALPVGSDTVTANYADGNLNPASGSISQTVNRAATIINVTSVSPGSETYGQNAPVTITAVLSWVGSGSAPTAANVIIGGNGPSGYSATTCGSTSGNTITCTATYTPTSADAAGSYTESAVFSGDGNYTSSSSPQSGDFVINDASSTVTVASNLNPSLYGQSVTFTATIASDTGAVKGRDKKGHGKSHVLSGTVTWSGNTGCAPSSVSGYPGTATCTTSSLAVGSDTVQACYSGDRNHSNACGAVSETVSQATTSINVTNVNPAAEDYGLNAPVTITAVLAWSGNGTPTAADVTIGGNGPGSYSATGCGVPSGNTLTCTATYTPAPADSPGSYTESASFSGDTNYTSSTSSQTNNFAINLASSSTSVSSSSANNTSNYGDSVTFTAAVNGENGNVRGRSSRKGNVKSHTVTGSVTWSANTGCGTTSVTSGNPGVAACTTSKLNAGSDMIVATYSGDSNHSSSSGSVTQTVNQASQTIIFTTNPPASAAYGSSFTVAASASSGLAIAYSSSGACSNSGATYTMTSGTGSCSVIANQAGSINYSAAPQVTYSVNAIKANPTVSFTGLPATLPYRSSYALTATTNASTTATITDSTSTVCSLSGSAVNIVKDSGTCSLTAAWAADSNYNSATVPQSGTAAKGEALITWSPPAAIHYGTMLSSAQLDATATPSTIYPTAKYSPASGKVLGTGSQALTVTYAPRGNSNYATTTGTVTLVVQPASTATTVTSSDQTITLNKSGSASATVDFNVSSYKPTGTVTLTTTPAGPTCADSVSSASGDGHCKLTFNSQGTWTINASYGGDANHTGSSVQSPITVTVN